MRIINPRYSIINFWVLFYSFLGPVIIHFWLDKIKNFQCNVFFGLILSSLVFFFAFIAMSFWNHIKTIRNQITSPFIRFFGKTINQQILQLISFMINGYIVITYYAIIYFEIFRFNPNNFHNPTAEPLEFFDFIYFSTITFSTTGYGDIYPQSTYLRMITTTEIWLGIIILILLVANFHDFLKTDNKPQENY